MPESCRICSRSFISTLRFSTSGCDSRLGELLVEFRIGIGRLVPGLAAAVAEHQNLNAQRTHVPGGHREGILRPVVPEGRARQHCALHLDAGLADLRGDRIAGVLVPILVGGDQVDARNRPGRLRPSASWRPPGRVPSWAVPHTPDGSARHGGFPPPCRGRHSRAGERSRCRPPSAARCAPSGRHRACC